GGPGGGGAGRRGAGRVDAGPRGGVGRGEGRPPRRGRPSWGPAADRAPPADALAQPPRQPPRPGPPSVGDVEELELDRRAAAVEGEDDHRRTLHLTSRCWPSQGAGPAGCFPARRPAVPLTRSSAARYHRPKIFIAPRLHRSTSNAREARMKKALAVVGLAVTLLVSLGAQPASAISPSFFQGYQSCGAMVLHTGNPGDFSRGALILLMFNPSDFTAAQAQATYLQLA